MKRVLEANEVERLLGTFSGAPTARRNRALVALMWRSGVRVGEALALRLGDLDSRSGEVAVLHGKGGKARRTAMDRRGWEELDRWLAMRRRLGIGRGAPVFCTLKGGPIAQPYVRTMLRRKAARADLDVRRVHPHAFRHAFALGLAREGKPVDHIRQLLGHASLATTAAYLARVDPAEVLDSARRREAERPLSPEEVATLRGLLARAEAAAT